MSIHFDELDGAMRALEVFHQVRIPEDQRIIVRVDGRCFSKLTAREFEKPFDGIFHDDMVQTAQALLEDLGGIYAYTESDEISLLLPRNWNMFSREHEKLISTSAGIASAHFSILAKQPATFDSRVIVPRTLSDITQYFRWRMLDANRCCLNSYVYWTLRKNGKSVGEATSASNGADYKQKIALLEDYGIDYEALPNWQRRGTGLYWVDYDKEGFDPIRKETVTARRRRVHIDEDLPGTIDYTSMIAGLIAVLD